MLYCFNFLHFSLLYICLSINIFFNKFFNLVIIVLSSNKLLINKKKFANLIAKKV